MEPESGRPLDGDENDRLAVGAADDSARGATVDDQCPKAVDRAASGAAALTRWKAACRNLSLTPPAKSP
jgi:hypothetical protein